MAIMATGSVFGLGRQKWAAGSIAWATDNIKPCLLNPALVGAAITGATNATPIVITSNSHGLSNGMRVAIIGVGGNTAANGVFDVKNVTTNTFELIDILTGANIAGNGAYTSGGYLMKLDILEFLSNISAGVVSTGSNLANKTNVLGTLDADDFSFTSVTTASGLVLVYYKDTGVAGTSPLLVYEQGGTGFPLNTNGTNVNITINPAGIIRL